jgi:putative oxidoreductase
MNYVSLEEYMATRWMDRGLLLLRLSLGSVFVTHGWQKLVELGPAGVTGFLASMGVPLPGINALLLIGVELLGGLALIAGVFTRAAASAIAFAMLVATLLVHLPNGYFLPNGIEFTLTLMLAGLAVTMTGAGAYSVDAHLFGREPLSLLVDRGVRKAA